MKNAEKVLDRLKNIQNSSKNLGWGVSEYSPLMKIPEEYGNSEVESQWVIVVGHNVYRKMHTMFLTAFSDGTYILSCDLDKGYDCELFSDILEKIDDDTLVLTVLCLLKEWFPEVRRSDLV